MQVYIKKAIIPTLAILFAIGVPLVLALYLTYNQALEAEFKTALSHALQVQHRADITGVQIDYALELLN